MSRLPPRFYALLGLLAAVFLLAACSRPSAYREESFVFGTRVEITTWGAPEPQARTAVNAVLREFDRMHHAYHAWQPSELSTLNTAIAAGQAASVSPELAGMLRQAQGFAVKGDDLFNPAIGQLIGLWGFQSDQFTARDPDPAAIAALVAAKPSLADLMIAGQQVTSRNRAVKIDLGGFAKGWALDRARTILHQQGIHNALINIGGNIMALGSKDGQPWRVGIQHPRHAGALATLPLHDGEAIGTSGDYQRFFEFKGKRYCHLIDPRVGRPADQTQSLTVLITPQADAGTLSDVASKPPFIDGAHWRERLLPFGVTHALRVDAQGKVEVTRALARRLKFADDAPAATLVE